VSTPKEIVVAGATKEQIYNKVRDWTKRYTISSREEPSSGLIVSTGEIMYPSPTIDRIQHSFIFTMKNTIQGNKDMVAFESIQLKTPTTYLSESSEEIAGKVIPVESERDIIAARKVLSRLTDNLEADLLAKNDEGCILSNVRNAQH
jgi:hypothetical protein